MSNKPDWNGAPEWAMWLAQDFDGWWAWFNGQPYTPVRASVWLEREGKYEISHRGDTNALWRNTLEPRP